MSAQVHLDTLDRTLLCLKQKKKKKEQSSERTVYTVHQV